MNLHIYKLEYFRLLSSNYIIAFLIVAHISGLLQASELVDVPQSQIVKAIAGSWTVVKEVQGFFDDISSRPNSQGGVVEKFQIKIIEMEEFWDFRQVRQVEEAIKKLATADEHEIVATGLFQASVARKPWAGFDGFFLLTQKNGESFLSVLNIDGATFMPWRIHHIPGKNRDKDLLIVEFGEFANSRQVTIFQYDGEIDDNPVPAKKGTTKWNGRIEIRNTGTQLIRVERVTNFKGFVSGGNVPPGSVSGMNFRRMELVEDFTIKWKERGERYNRQLTLKDIPLSKRKGSLILEYSGGEEWRVYFEDTAS